MARGFGMTALRAALGGVAGGLEGLGAMREEERVRKEAEAAKQRQADLDRLGMLEKRFMPVSQIESTQQAGGEALSRALSSATAMLRPGGLGAGAMLQAGDIGRIAQGRASMAPQQRATFGGVEYTRETPESYEASKAATESALELQKYGKQQDLIAERTKAANDRANRGYFQVLQRAGSLPSGVTYEDMQDIDLKPYFDEYRQQQSAEAAENRARIMAGAQRSMVGSYQTGIGPDGKPIIFGFTRGGEAVPTGVEPTATKNPLAENIARTARPMTPEERQIVMDYMPKPRQNAAGKIIGYDPPKKRLSFQSAIGSLGKEGTASGELMLAATDPDAQMLSAVLNRSADMRVLIEQGARTSDADVRLKRTSVKIRSAERNNDPLIYSKLSQVLRWDDEARAQEQQRQGQPVGAADGVTRPAAAVGMTKAQFAEQWKAQNPQRDNEELAAYAYRLKVAWEALQGKK